MKVKARRRKEAQKNIFIYNYLSLVGLEILKGNRADRRKSSSCLLPELDTTWVELGGVAGLGVASYLLKLNNINSYEFNN